MFAESSFQVSPQVVDQYNGQTVIILDDETGLGIQDIGQHCIFPIHPVINLEYLSMCWFGFVNINTQHWESRQLLKPEAYVRIKWFIPSPNKHNDHHINSHMISLLVRKLDQSPATIVTRTSVKPKIKKWKTYQSQSTKQKLVDRINRTFMSASHPAFPPMRGIIDVRRLI